MKTFTEVCESICGQMAVTFIAADLDEANLLIDSLKKSQFPVLVLIPYEVGDTKSKSGLVKSVIPFQFFMLDRNLDQATVDFGYAETLKKIVEPMRGKAREFVTRLEHYREDGRAIIDQETEGITQRRYRPTFSSGDASIHGIDATMNVPVIEDINGCV